MQIAINYWEGSWTGRDCIHQSWFHLSNAEKLALPDVGISDRAKYFSCYSTTLSPNQWHLQGLDDVTYAHFSVLICQFGFCFVFCLLSVQANIFIYTWGIPLVWRKLLSCPWRALLTAILDWCWPCLCSERGSIPNALAYFTPSFLLLLKTNIDWAGTDCFTRYYLFIFILM